MAKIISRKYEIMGLLGQGGMGVVYKVRHTQLDLISALKVLSSDFTENQDLVARFSREARVMARLNHPNIVRVMDIDRDENLNLFYFVMEYIEGKTLGQYVREKGPLDLHEVFTITRQVASALSYAHTHNPSIIHRDIKPANIMLENRTGRVVVMDFGIAKEVGESDTTKTGVAVGTLKYASPEQLRHEDLEGSADVYSLGMVVYEMYTGKQFFAGLDEHTVLGHILNDQTDNLPQFNRPAPSAFVNLVTKAIAKSRTRRYQHMADFLAALESCEAAEDEPPTLILAPQARGDVAKEPESGDVHAIEQQIRELREERQRRLVSPIQLQAREARARAAREGAPDLAAALFQQALEEEEHGNEGLRKRAFEEARSAYQEAIVLFDRAGEAAKTAATQRKAEQARNQMLVAKAEAEQYGARERARNFYSRGLVFQTQADELCDREDYPQAIPFYTDAARLFADARELAYLETLREEAAQATGQALTAKEQAEQLNARDLAPELYDEAVKDEQRGATARERQEYVQARQWYFAASQKYTLAGERARLEQQVRRAQIAQQQATEARQAADAVNAIQHAKAIYQEATASAQQADNLGTTQQHEAAAAAYEQAHRLYLQATRDAVQNRERQAAGAARSQTEQARTRADQAQGKTRLQQEYHRAEALLQQGLAHEGADRFGEAVSYFNDAAEQFAALARIASQHLAQERADEARQQMIATRDHDPSLFAWGAQGWTTARALETQAEHAYQREAYEDAAKNFRQALEAYERAYPNAAREQSRHEAQQALEHAKRTRAEAQQDRASDDARELHQQAVLAFNDAERLLREEDFQQARDRAQHAATVFAQARAAALIQQARRVAVAARTQLATALAAARQADAHIRIADLFTQAETLADQARNAEAQEDFVAATEHYSQATQLFTTLKEQALSHAAKERAEAARQHVQDSKAPLAPLAECLGPTAKEAQQREAAGEQAWKAQQYDAATQHYQHAAQRYEAARAEAEQARARQLTETTRHDATRARMAAENSGAKQYASPSYQQGLEQQRKAERLFQNKSWDDARAAFTQSQTLFTQAITEATRERERLAAAAAYQLVVERQSSAEQAVAMTELPDAFLEAQLLVEQGHEQVSRQEFTVAAATYQQAADRFAALRRGADVQRAREEAVAAQQEAERGKATAKAWQSWAQEAWNTLQQQEAEALRILETQDYARATMLYQQVAQQYEKVAVIGAVAQQQQEATQARDQSRSAHDKAEASGAAYYADEAFRRASTLWATGQQYWEREEFSSATQAYQQALTGFEEASRLVTVARQQAKTHTETARNTTQQTRQDVSTLAQQWATTQWTTAEQRRQQAEQFWQDEDYARAYEAYEQATCAYQDALQHAQAEQERQQAVAAQQVARASRTLADAADARQYASVLYQKALATEQEGQRLFAAGKRSEACEHWQQAASVFINAQQEAERQYEQATAQVAKEHAERAQQEASAVDGETLARQPFTEATTSLREALRMFDQGQLGVAQTAFEKSSVLFTQARNQAVTAAQAAQANVARTRCHTAMEAVRNSLGRNQKRKIDKVLAKSNKLFDAGDFVAARESYEELIRLLPTLATVPVPTPPATPTAKQPVPVTVTPPHTKTGIPLGVAAGVGSAILASTLYFSGVFGPTQQSQELSRPKESTPRPVKPIPSSSTGTPSVQSQWHQYQNVEPAPTTPDPSTSAPVTQEPEPKPEPVPPPSNQQLATVTPPANVEPPVDKGPAFTSVTPSEEKMPLVLEGKELSFAVHIEAIGTPIVTWFLDGKKQKEGTTWTYQPTYESAREMPHKVRVVANDKKHDPLEKTWQVRVQDVNRPPKVVSGSPQPGVVAVAQGQEQRFTIRAEDADKDDRLTYVWRLDGKEVERGDAASWQLPATATDVGHEIIAEVMDKAGKQTQVAWNITVRAPAQPPVLGRGEPREEKIVRTVGEPSEFSITTSLSSSDDGQKKLRFEWRVNDERQQKSETSRFRFIDAKPGTYTIEVVAVSPVGLRSNPRRWTVELQPRPLPPPIVVVPPPTVAAIPQNQQKPQTSQLSEGEARSWMESIYRPAWEEKNIPFLVELGEVSLKNAAQVTRVLNGYRSFQVQVRILDTQVSGNRATVRFQRLDTIDGKTLSLPAKEITIEKDASGRIRRRE